MNRWRGAIAASFVAGLVGVGIWMMPQNAPENALIQQAQNVPASLQQPSVGNNSAVQALPVVARVTPGTVLPSWAQAPVRKAPMDPYLMTHFESVSPDLSEVMPSLRMTSFQTE
jgi:sigma-E factor negative regulatory protein RseA